MRGGKIHFARLENSARLKRVKRILDDGEPHSTREIIFVADVCAVNSIVSELRENGYPVRCDRKSKNRWIYQKG